MTPVKPLLESVNKKIFCLITIASLDELYINLCSKKIAFFKFSTKKNTMKISEVCQVAISKYFYKIITFKYKYTSYNFLSYGNFSTESLKIHACAKWQTSDTSYVIKSKSSTTN